MASRAVRPHGARAEGGRGRDEVRVEELCADGPA
jgi:hypothetical protein